MEGFLSPWGRPQSEKKGTNHSDRIHIEISRPNTTKYNHTQRSPNATSRVSGFKIVYSIIFYSNREDTKILNFFST